MNHLKKIIVFLLTILVISQLAACNKKTKDDGNSSKNNIEFSDVMALSQETNSEKIYKLKEKQLLDSGNLVKTQNINYNINKKTTVYTKKIKNGDNLIKNYIEITDKDKTYVLNKDFSYEDLRLSNSGDYIAFRSFSSDDITSAKGLQVYNIKTRKQINFDKKIFVSGNLYQWDDKDTLFYYGIDISKRSYGKIYSSEVEKSQNKVVFDKFNGYCTFFSRFISGDMLYIENDSEKYNMYYYDSKKDNKIPIATTVENIYNYTLDNKNNILYFIGDDGSSSPALYSFNINTKKIDKLTYDFPNVVDKNGGIAVNNLGYVYFCGNDTLDVDKNKIYMYNNSDKSINLITNESNNSYHIISNEK